MLDETSQPAAAGVAASPAADAGNGNGAPPWLDHATLSRYTHFDRLPLHAMVGLDPDLTLVLDAHFIGCDPQSLQAIRQQHDRDVAAAVEELLAHDEFAADLARVPGVTGERIVVLGDSITADTLSWASLLQGCLERGGDPRPPTVRNLAISGFTSSETIPLFELVTRARPTCVLAMLGTNDGRRQGSRARVRTVSTAETARNLLALRQLSQDEADARFLAIAPPPMHQDRFDRAVPGDAPASFSTADLADTTAAIRTALPETIDLPGLLGAVPDTFWIPDGLHPTLDGQRAILRQVVHALAELEPVTI